MKPENPPPPHPPRDLVDRAGARPVDGGRLCPICEALPVPGRRGKLIPLATYRSGQHDLLERILLARFPGATAATLFHTGCLERGERELQSAELAEDRDEADRHLFVDLTLSGQPILPTPERMGALPGLTGRGITIAFVDSDFHPHPDLVEPEGRIVACYDAVADRPVPLEQFMRRRQRPPKVPMWHGTMAAATAAGSGLLSHGRYRGIASGARLVLVRAMTPKFRIQTPQVLAALRWLREVHERYDIRVINLSLGVDETAQSLEHPVIRLVEELVERGVVVVAASGNNPMNPIKPPGSAPSSITVGGYNDNNSVDWRRREIWHSSYIDPLGGGRKPELLAPSIWVAAPILRRTAVHREARALMRLAEADDTTLMELIPMIADRTAIAAELMAARRPLHARSIVLARMAIEKLITADYKHVDGTSFAAPIVSSIVAQMLERDGSLTPRVVKERLTSTAALIPDVSEDVQGYGVVQAAAAVGGVIVRPSGEDRAR